MVLFNQTTDGVVCCKKKEKKKSKQKQQKWWLMVEMLNDMLLARLFPQTLAISKCILDSVWHV